MGSNLKPDFDSCAHRWVAFWRGEALDRPMILAVVPKPDRPTAPKPYPIRPDRDVSQAIAQTLAWAASHDFVGDAIPFLTMEFGAEHFATFLGAEMRYHETYDSTGWVVPFVRDWDAVELRLDRDSFYWRRTLEFIRALRASCEGRVLICAPALSAGMDALSAIRGPERLLTDLVDCPGKVRRALAQVRQVYGEVVDVLKRELAWDELGTANWNGMYHPGRTNTIQSDVSCMLSPRMFADFEVANLRDQARHYDAVAYHLDGPGAIRHLEAICAIEGIKAVQYVPIPRERPEDVEALYDRLDSLGMAAVRNAGAAEIKRLWGKSQTRRLVIHTHFATREAAECCIASLS
jgi:hypothetical protein